MAIGDDYKPRANPPEISDATRKGWANAERRFADEKQRIADEAEVREYLVGTGRYGASEVAGMSSQELHDAIKNYGENLLLGTDSAAKAEHVLERIFRAEAEEEEALVRDYLVGSGRFGEVEVGRMSTDELQKALQNYAENLRNDNDSAVRSEFRQYVEDRVKAAADEDEIRNFLVGTGYVGTDDAAGMTRDDLHDALVDYAEHARSADGGDSRAFDPKWVSPTDIGVAPVDIGVAPTEPGLGAKGGRDGTTTTTAPGNDGGYDDTDSGKPSSTSNGGGGGGADDPIGEDPFIVPGSQPRDTPEEGGEEGSFDGGDDPAGTEPTEEPVPSNDEDGEDGEDGGGTGGEQNEATEEEDLDSGYDGPPTSFDSGEDYSQTDAAGNELSDDEAFGNDDGADGGTEGGDGSDGGTEDAPPAGEAEGDDDEDDEEPENSGGDDDDDEDDDDDGEGSGGEEDTAGGGAGDVIPGSDSDYGFNQTGLGAMQARAAQGLPNLTRNGGDIDPVDDDFGSGEASGGPSRPVPGVDNPGTSESGRTVGFGSGGPLTRNDGVTDPAQDDDTGGGIGPEEDPLAGGSPGLEEEAPDEPVEDEDADSAPALGSRVRSRLEEAIDDGRIDVDDVEPDGYLMVDPG